MTQSPAVSPRLVEQADALRALHVPGTPLILANVWDVTTARAVASGGARAIATASAAIAPANGLEDHGKMPADFAFAVLRRIAEATQLPVTADLEHGYGLPPDDLIDRLLDAGACGLNLEDTDHASGAMVEVNAQADRIAALRAAATACGCPVVINARIDTHYHKLPIGEGLRRAEAYRQAGRRYRWVAVEE